jgi:hypothetical protein
MKPIFKNKKTAENSAGSLKIGAEGRIAKAPCN